MSKAVSVRRVEAELMDDLCERGCLVEHARTARGSLVLHGRRRQAEQLQMAPRSRELGGRTVAKRVGKTHPELLVWMGLSRSRHT